jgi:hypothetical protein
MQSSGNQFIDFFAGSALVLGRSVLGKGDTGGQQAERERHGNGVLHGDFLDT